MFQRVVGLLGGIMRAWLLAIASLTVPFSGSFLAEQWTMASALASEKAEPLDITNSKRYQESAMHTQTRSSRGVPTSGKTS